MSCGYEMTELVPGEWQYIDVKDKRVLQIMRFIFQTTEEGNFAHSIREVRVHSEFTLQNLITVLVAGACSAAFSRMPIPLFREVGVPTTLNCQVT